MDVDSSSPSADLRGAVLMAAFSLAWFMWAASSLQPPWRARAAAVGLVLPAALLALGRRTARVVRRDGPPPSPFRVPFYRWAVLFEALAVPVAVIVLSRLNLSEYIPTAVAVIVGVHFLGLTAAFGGQLYTIVGLGMIGVGVAAPFGAPAADWVVIVSGGCGVILWVTAAIRILAVRTALASGES
ncbi:MAG: hypothetical protein KGN76_15125 [Acidobacteriota bacterium]|nr:hypothetical protein [Acidobacteriota bacterium]